jgi:hypothetical protein
LVPCLKRENNMKTHYLSQEERDTGLKYFSIFTLLNGLGFGFLADTVVYLLAIHFGASNMQLGYISSIIYLSGIMLIFTPKIIAGHNLVRVFFWAWLLRGFFCLINAAVLFVSGQIAVAIILISYSLFCLSRTVGASLNNPVIQSISTTENLGNILTHNTAYNNFGSILGRIASYILMSIAFFKGLFGLMVLQGLGILFNTIASLFLRKVPCRETIQNAPGHNILSHFKRGLFDKKKFIPLMLFWNNLSVMVLAGFVIPLLRKTIGFEENTVFLYTITTAIATTCAMYLMRPFIDKVSLKPFILANSFLNVLFFSIWSFIHPGTPVYSIFILGFFFMFLNGMNQSVVNRILISSIPHTDKVNYNSMVYFIAGIIALLFGIAAGALGDIGENHHPLFFNHYYLIFGVAIVFSVITFILALSLDGRSPNFFQSPQNIVRTFRNIKSLFDVYHLEMAKDPEERQSILMSLKYRSAPFAIAAIRKILKNPLSSETEEVLKSLFVKPRIKLLPDILECANDKGFYHRATAIFTLGAYPNPEVAKSLIEHLDDESPRIRSNAAKSLARIGNKDHLEKIIALSESKENSTWDILNYIISIFTIDRNSSYLYKIFGIAHYYSDKSYNQSIFSMFARVMGCIPELSSIYQSENCERFSGLKVLLDEARQFDVFYKNTGLIKENFLNKNYSSIWDLFKSILTSISTDAPYEHIRKAILDFSADKADDTTTIAMIYFSFFILADEAED